MVSSKQERQAIILDIVKSHRVTSHDALGELLRERGIQVTQATLSRDIRELRLVKVPGAEGVSHYRLPESWEKKPPLRDLLPILFLSAEGAENLIVIRTLLSGAAAVATAIDWEDWPEVIGTVAGEDTIIVVLRDAELMPRVRDRLIGIAGGEPG